MSGAAATGMVSPSINANPTSIPVVRMTSLLIVNSHRRRPHIRSGLLEPKRAAGV
jgi:hypothetical protein